MSEITPETPATQPTPRAPMARRTKVLIGAGAAALLVLGGTGIAFAATDGFEMDDDDRTNISQQQGPAQGGNAQDDNRDNSRDDDDYNDAPDAEDATISDADRAKVEAAGLKAAGGDGKVTDLERSNDLDHAWEVEVTYADGRDIDVELAADFTVTRVDKN
ncbi:hypothetical protein EYE40_11650 [Glaciihabitans arcticus]|uniref:PepSY domain-containing protein n=1 Tax=Glaciihabitans arcticus TaxID=2668039 RepID=A0A4Q9GSJ8_9MICO|nr:hypothetical protein [Glaciihabitans arcticus]TBN57996.1 hypothetical protein EYE40_11650 [Glaciihabitans arcticus]